MNLDQQLLPYTNINSKWIIHRDVKSTSVKSITIKFQENLCNFRLDKDSLKTKITNYQKINELDFIKM